MDDRQGSSASGAADATAGAAFTSSGTVRQTIVETLEAPRLTGVTTAHFVEFKEKREIYERRVAESNLDTGVKIQLTMYRNSIPNHLLKMMIIGDLIKASSVDTVIEDQIRTCKEEQAKVDLEDYDLDIIEHKLKEVKLSKREGNTTLEAQVWDLCVRYSETLEKCGYTEFIEKKPALAVEHVMKRITYPELRSRMLSTIKLHKEEGFKKDFKRFFKALTQEAKVIDKREVTKSRHTDAFDSDDDISIPEKSNRRRRNRNHGWRGRRKNKGTPFTRDGEDNTDAGTGPSSLGKRSRDPPACLNPKCDGHHYIVDCPISTDEEKKRLKREYHEAKNKKFRPKNEHEKKRKPGHVGQLSGPEPCENSSLFAAAFCGGAVEVIALADQGSDANMISPSVLGDIMRADPNVKITTLPKTLLYRNAKTSAPPISCSRQIQADIMLRIRHWTNLMLRRMKWLVSDEQVYNVFIGRHVLSALGLNNRVLLSAACDRYEGLVDVPDALHKNGTMDGACADGASTPSIYSILQDREFELGSTYHSQGGDCMDDEVVYVDLGEDSPEDLKKAREEMVLRAKENGLSDKGVERLTDMLERHKTVFESG